MSNPKPSEWRAVFKALEGAPRHIWKAVYRTYLKSEAWAELRSKIHYDYEGRCDNCMTKSGAMHVHHKTYERVGDEEYYDLKLLGEKCHLLEHGLVCEPKWWFERMQDLFGHPAHPPVKPWEDPKYTGRPSPQAASPTN